MRKFKILKYNKKGEFFGLINSHTSNWSSDPNGGSIYEEETAKEILKEMRNSDKDSQIFTYPSYLQFKTIPEQYTD